MFINAKKMVGENQTTIEIKSVLYDIDHIKLIKR